MWKLGNIQEYLSLSWWQEKNPFTIIIRHFAIIVRITASLRYAARKCFLQSFLRLQREREFQHGAHSFKTIFATSLLRL